jgi:hypothetical protein
MEDGSEVIERNAVSCQRASLRLPSIPTSAAGSATTGWTEHMGDLCPHSMSHESHVLASISTVLERANARLKTGSQANRTTSFLSPNHGIGVGVAASPEATRYGL